MIDSAVFELDEEICAFFVDLVSKQEPLGDEFAKVLHDNLWDLLVLT